MANWYRPNYPEVRSRVLGLPEKVRACLFDLDGVLTDTASLHTKAWKAMFDAYLAERAERTGEKFVPFDPAADYHTYVDGKKREDGVRSFLSSRAIEIPDGSPDDPGAAETVYGLGNRKNDMLHKLLRDDGAQCSTGRGATWRRSRPRVSVWPWCLRAPTPATCSRPPVWTGSSSSGWTA